MKRPGTITTRNQSSAEIVRGFAGLDLGATFGLPARQAEEEAAACREAESGYPDRHTKSPPLGETAYAAVAGADQQRLVAMSAATTLQLETVVTGAKAEKDRHDDEVEKHSAQVDAYEEKIARHDQ